MNRTRSLQMAGATVASAATLLFGLGAAGALPGAAQDVASTMLGQLGVSTPAPDSHSDGHADERGTSQAPDVRDAGVGSTVSSLGTDDATTGLEKGATVSGEASGDASQAGEHGAAEAGISAAAVDAPPVATPPVDTPPVA